MDFGYPVWLIELLSNIFYNERTWWGLVQKRVVNTELYFYVFIWLLLSLQLCWWAVIPQGYHPPSSQCNVIRTPLKTGSVLRSSGRVSCS
jgi:hypothetical protein